MMEGIVREYGMAVLMAVITAMAGMLGFGCRRIYKAFVNDQQKEAVAHYAALFVEQVYTSLHGWEKRNKALETARVFLEKKGICFDEAEMKVLIEAAVAEFNDAFNRPMEERNEGTLEIDDGDDSEMVLCPPPSAGA